MVLLPLCIAPACLPSCSQRALPQINHFLSRPCYSSPVLAVHTPPFPMGPATFPQALPVVFVGPLRRLDAAVALIAEEVAAAFRAAGRSLPPWRTKGAMLSKWAPDQLQELERLLQHAHDVAGEPMQGQVRGGYGAACCALRIGAKRELKVTAPPVSIRKITHASLSQTPL